MISLHGLFIVLWVGTFAAMTVLSVVNLRHSDRKLTDESAWLRDNLDTDPGAVAGYLRLNTGTGRLKSFLGLIGLGVVIYSGWVAGAVEWLETTALSDWSRGMVFFLAAAGVAWLVSLPFSLYDQFVVEELFDFNQQDIRGFLLDQVRGIAVGLVLFALLSGVVLYLLEAFPSTWWLIGWAVVVGFSFAMQIIYPRFIAPLFNDFEPVSGDLREAVDDVFDRAGFVCDQVYTMDASRRSGHSNAYFVGFGRTKRVVLFDTLLEHLNREQIQAVLAHELAHWKKGHVWQRLGLSALRTGVVFGILFYLVEASWLYEMFWLPAGARYAGLLMGLLWVSPVMTWLAPLENRRSLANEEEADEFSREIMGTPEPLVGALYGLAGENLSNPFPHPLYAAFHLQHPPVPERARRLNNSH